MRRPSPFIRRHAWRQCGRLAHLQHLASRLLPAGHYQHAQVRIYLVDTRQAHDADNWIPCYSFAIRTKEVENRVTVDEREHRPPAAKPHFASLSKAMHLSAPPSRPMTAMAPARALVVPVSTKKTVVPAGRAFGTDVKNVASEARPRTASSGKPGVVIGRGGPTVVKGSVKGKGRQVEEVDVEALVRASIAWPDPWPTCD